MRLRKLASAPTVCLNLMAILAAIFGDRAHAADQDSFCAESLKLYNKAREDAFRQQAFIEAARTPGARNTGSIDAELSRLARLQGLQITVQLMIAKGCALPEQPFDVNPDPLKAFRCGQHIVLNGDGKNTKQNAEKEKVCGF